MRHLSCLLLTLLATAAESAPHLITRHLQPGSFGGSSIEDASTSGRYLMIRTAARDLTPVDPGGFSSLVRYDLDRDRLTGYPEEQALGSPQYGLALRVHQALSEDGRFYYRLADPDEDGFWDLFRLDLGQRTMARLSEGLAFACPGQRCGFEVWPALSGQRVLLSDVTETGVGRTTQTTRGSVFRLDRLRGGMTEPVNLPEDARRLQASLDGRRLVWASAAPVGNSLHWLADTARGEPVVLLESVLSYALSANGRRLAAETNASSGDGEVSSRTVLVDLDLDQTLHSLEGLHFVIDIAADGSVVALRPRLEDTVLFWFSGTGERLDLRSLRPGRYQPRFNTPTLSPDGHYAAVLDGDGLVVIDLVRRQARAIGNRDESCVGGPRRLTPTPRGLYFQSDCPPEGVSASLPEGESNVYFLPRDEILTEPHRFVLGAPVTGRALTGVTTLRGWALVEDHQSPTLRLRIDGEDLGEIAVGDTRDDVAAVFPDVPGASQSGFAAAYDFNNLPTGVHQVELELVSDAGRQFQSALIETTRLSDRFVRNPRAANFSAVNAEGDRDRLLLRNVIIDGCARDLELAWRVADQSLVVVGLSPDCSP